MEFNVVKVKLNVRAYEIRPKESMGVYCMEWTGTLMDVYGLNYLEA